MTRTDSSFQLNTFHDLLCLLKSGDRLIVCFSSAADSRALYLPILHSFKNAKNVIALSPNIQPLGGSIPAFAPTRSSAECLSSIKKQVRQRPRVSGLLFECSVSIGRWYGKKHQRHTFLEGILTFVKKSRFPGVIQVIESDFSVEELSRLKNQAEFFLHVSNEGPWHVSQLLSAHDYYHPGIFKPHVILPGAKPSDALRFLPVAVQPVTPPEGQSIPGSPASFQDVFESSPVALLRYHRTTNRVQANARALSLLGRTREEVGTLTLQDINSPGSAFAILRMMVALKRKNRASAEITARKKDGRSLVLDVSATRVSETEAVFALNDITERKRTEYSVLKDLEQYKTLVQRSPAAVVMIAKRKVAFTNDTFGNLFPWLKDKENLSLTDMFGRGNAPLIKAVSAIGESVEKDAKHFKQGCKVTTPQGEEKFFNISAVAISHGSTVATLCSLVDTTEFQSVVRELEHRRNYFQQLFDDAGEAISLDQDGILVYVNKKFVTMFGYDSMDALIGKKIDSMRAGKIHESFQGGKKSAPTKPETIALEYEGIRKDSSRMSIEAQAVRMSLNGIPTIVTYHRDVTERKQNEEQFRKSVQAAAIAQRVIKSVGGSLDLTQVLNASIDALIKSYSMDFGGFYLVHTLHEQLSLGHVRNIPERIAGTLSTQSPVEGITGFVIKTQEPLIVTSTAYPPFLPYKSLFEADQIHTVVYLPLVCNQEVIAVALLGSGKPKPLSATHVASLELLRDQLGDVVSAARQFTFLREAEERYRSSVENISDVIYHISAQGTLVFISPNVERLLGYKAQEIHASPDVWRMIIHPDDRSKYSQRISHQNRDIDNFSLEYRMLPKGKASYRWVRDSVRYKRGEDGELNSITGILSDITDRIELEAALIKSEELKTNVLESVQEGVAVMDSGFTYIDWNNAMQVITGIAREQVIGRSAFESTPQLVSSDIRPLLTRALAGESVSTEDIPFSTSNQDEKRFVWTRYSPLKDSTGAIRGVVGIVTDVSNRKRLEREVRESEETLRNVIDAMGDALMISDLQGRVWEVNREFSQVTGYSRNEILGADFPYPWVLDEEMAMFVKWIAALREKNYLRDFDMTWRRKDGHDVAISLNTTMLRNAFGEPVAMLNIGRDITDRRRLSLELARKNKQIELLNRIISKANTTMNFDEIFDTIAKEVSTLVPFDQINVGLLTDAGSSMTTYACLSPVGKVLPVGTVTRMENTVSRLAIDQDKPIVINNLTLEPGLGNHTTSIIEGLHSQIVVPFYLHDRILGTFCVASDKPDAFTGEELAILQPIADQIGAMVDRVRLFQKVSDDSAYIHNLVNSIDSVVFTVDPEYRITEANKAWRDFAATQGWELFSNENTVLGRPLEEILRGQTLWPTLKDVMRRLFEGEVDFYTQEFEIERPSVEKTYQLAINPMIINQKVTGLVFTFTDITSIKKTEEEVRQRNKELVALNTISTSISTSLQLNDVLRVAAEQIREIVGANPVLFYLHDSSREELVLSHSLGLSAEMAAKIRSLRTSSSATGSVITSRQPLYIRHDLTRDDRITSAGREIFSALGVNSLGAIPLQSKERVLGAMDVCFPTPHEFSEKEQQLLLLIGNQIGAAIENAQLYAEVQKQVSRITSLYELGKHLSGALDTRALLESVWSEVSRVLPIDRFSYLLFNPATNSTLPMFEASGKEVTIHAQGKPGETLITPESFLWEVVTHGTTLRYSGLEETSIGVSQLVVPVKSEDELIGVLMLAKKGEEVYSEAHLRLLESIANLTEIAVERARLYEDTINKSMEIEARNKELDDFTYVVSHDLKEPLISIEGYSKILLKDYKGKIDDEGTEYLSSVVQSTARMKSLIDDLLTLSRLGRVTETLQTVSASHLIDEILHDLRFLLQEKHVDVIVPAVLPDVRYNATQLSMVFRNLISNALKFNSTSSPVITIGHREEGDYHIFSVADNGIGIDEQYFEKIFMIFQRLQRNEEYRGTGAGLTIVKKIVEKHHGRIWVESTVGEGSVFSFSVPK